MKAGKGSKGAKQPEAQQEQKLILKDVKDKMFRAAVVPAAYSVEEFLLGMCKFDEIRMKTIKLTEDEVGYGQFAMRNLGKRIMSAYFKPNPKLFEEIFGFPLSELKEEGLLCMRPWHDEVIMVMAPPKPPMRCFYNSIIRETLSSNDQTRVSWTGNLLCLSSSLQSEICPDLGGVTRYALNGLLQEKLGKAAAPALEAAWKSKQAGLDMQKQFGWIRDLPQPGPPAPPPSAPLDKHLEFMITGWKQTRCLLPYRHAPDKCTGYHMMAAGVNSNNMVFDARRPPIGKDGEVLYQPEWCRSGPDVSVREGKDTAYYSCPAGPSCNKAHSRLELFYHPGFFKHEKCEGVSGGKCSCQEAGTPEYICAFWHSRAETNALSAILPRVATTITPPWEARDRAWDDSSEDEQTTAAAVLAVTAGSNGAVVSIGTGADGLAAAALGQQGLLAEEGSSGWVGLSAEGSATSTAAAADDGVGVEDPEGVFVLEGVDMEALRYLYYGPPDNQDLVEWFYVDPNQDIQGPFSAADMYSWCSQGLLPLDLPLHPGTGDGVRPQALDEFWPMHTLLGMAADALRQQQEAAAAAAAAAVMTVPAVQAAGAAQPSTPQPVSPAARGGAANGGFSSSAPQPAARSAALGSAPTAPTAAPVVAAVAAPVVAPVVVPAAVQPANTVPAAAATASPAKQPPPPPAAAAAAATAAMTALRPSSAGSAAAGVSSSSGGGTMTRGLSSSNLSAAAAAYDPTRPAAAAAAAGAAAAPAATAALAPKALAVQSAAADSSRDSSAVSTSNTGSAKAGPEPPAAAAVEQPALGSSKLSKLALNVNAPAFTYKPGGSSAPSSVNSATVTPTAAQVADKAAAAAVGSVDAGGSSSTGVAQQQQPVKESKRLAIKAPSFSPLGPSGHTVDSSLQDAAAASSANVQPAAATADAQPSSAADTAAAAAAVAAAAKEAGSRPVSANSTSSMGTAGKVGAEAAAKTAAAAVATAAAAPLPSPGSLEFGTISSSIIEQMEQSKQQAAAAAAAMGAAAAVATEGVISSSSSVGQPTAEMHPAAAAAAPAGAEETVAVRTQDTAPQQQQQQRVSAGTDQGSEYDGGGNPYALLSAAEDASDNDEADMEQLAAAAAKTAAAAANSSRPSSSSGTGFFPVRAQAGRYVQVSVRVFDSQASNPKESVHTVSGTHPADMTGAQLMEHVAKSGQFGVSSSSSSPWSSVMLMWVRPGRPCPSLRLMQPQETLGELLQEFNSSSSSSSESSQLLFEAYCSRDGVFDPGNPRGIPLLHRLVYVGGSLKYKLEAVVDCGTTGAAAAGGRAVSKLDQVMMILEKAFEAAVQQGLLWRHDVDWAVFNTGLRRVDDGSPQLLFCSRRTWQPHHTAVLVSAPWVASNKLEDAAGVQHWMKGAVPPVPVLPDSIAAAISSSSSRGPTPPPPAAGGAVGRSWRPSDNGSISPAAAAVYDGFSPSWAQQQQPQQAVLWPASTYAYGPSVVSRIGSSSFGYGHFLGAYIPSALGGIAQQQQQQQQQGLGPVPVHAVGQPGTWPPAAAAAAVRAGRGLFGSTPLLSQPVLPTYPMPQGSGWGWADSSSSNSVSQLQEQQMQQLSQLFKQHTVKPFRDLKKGQGPQLLIKCSAQGPVQQQQQQQEQGSGQSVLWLLSSQHTPAEEVTAALTSEWAAGQQSSSNSRSLLLAYTSIDSSSGTTAWRLLQSAAVTPLVDAPDSAGAGIDTSSSSSSRVHHLLGAQMPFPAVLECINMEAYPVGDGSPAAAAGSVLSPVIGQCICWDSTVAASAISSSSSSGITTEELSALQQLCQQLQTNRSQSSSSSSSRSERQMLGEVASLAAAEHWGSAYRVLGQYISSTFYRAAVQGRLLVKTFSSSSSSSGGDDASGSNDSGVDQQLLLFNTGLVTEAGQHVLMLFLGNAQQQQRPDEASQDAQQDRPTQPWLYLGCASSYDCAALQPLPAPAAAPVAAFNPHLPLQVDVDALSAAFKSSYGAASDLEPKQQRKQRLRVLQSLTCRGQVLPSEVADTVIQGGIAKSLLLLQRTPQLACQVLVEGERLMYALPLMLFAGEPVRLVLLLELYTAPQTNSSSSSREAIGINGVHGAVAQQQQQQCGVLYCSQGVARFADVYPSMRSLGPCDWVSWVKEALAALQPDSTISSGSGGSGGGSGGSDGNTA